MNIEPSCKRCYWKGVDSPCLCPLPSTSDDPKRCTQFLLIDEDQKRILDHIGYGEMLENRFGYWEWRDLK